MKPTLFTKNITILLILVFFSSCSRVEKRGYSFELSNYQNLTESINDKKDVLNAMGYPTLSDHYGKEELWVYYSEDVEKFLFFKPEVLDRKVMVISFNKDVIKKIENFGLEDSQEFALQGNKTKVDSQKQKWWNRIFRNIGQVRAN